MCNNRKNILDVIMVHSVGGVCDLQLWSTVGGFGLSRQPGETYPGREYLCGSGCFPRARHNPGESAFAEVGAFPGRNIPWARVPLRKWVLSPGETYPGRECLCGSGCFPRARHNPGESAFAEVGAFPGRDIPRARVPLRKWVLSPGETYPGRECLCGSGCFPRARHTPGESAFAEVGAFPGRDIPRARVPLQKWMLSPGETYPGRECLCGSGCFPRARHTPGESAFAEVGAFPGRDIPQARVPFRLDRYSPDEDLICIPGFSENTPPGLIHGKQHLWVIFLNMFKHICQSCQGFLTARPNIQCHSRSILQHWLNQMCIILYQFKLFRHYFYVGPAAHTGIYQLYNKYRMVQYSFENKW